jgi:hypothetical protein
MSASSPFRNPSEHVGAAHSKKMGLQFPTAQSALAAHFEPSGHLRVQFEPQSTSASVPFLTLSLHVGFWQVRAVQTPLAQSAATLQSARSSHLVGQLPPQSTSVSVPFLAWSPHAAGAHTFAEQTPSSQSAFSLQAFPSAHPLGQSPPQSTSVSVPSFNVLEQPVATHVPVLQSPLAQSAFAAQRSFGAHFVEQLPPQSMSVSVPFCLSSLHVGPAPLSVAPLSVVVPASGSFLPMHTPPVHSWSSRHDVPPSPQVFRHSSFSQTFPRPQSASFLQRAVAESTHAASVPCCKQRCPVGQSTSALHALLQTRNKQR